MEWMCARLPYAILKVNSVLPSCAVSLLASLYSAVEAHFVWPQLVRLRSEAFCMDQFTIMLLRKLFPKPWMLNGAHLWYWPVWLSATNSISDSPFASPLLISMLELSYWKLQKHVNCQLPLAALPSLNILPV